MKTTSKTLIFLFILSLLSACKNTQNGEILPQINVEEGKYNMKIYDSSGKLVLTREGDAEYVRDYNWIMLLPDKAAITDEYLGILRVNKKESQTSSNNNNSGFFSTSFSRFDEKNVEGSFIPFKYVPEWRYELENGKMQLTDIKDNRIKGNLRFNLKNGKDAWGRIIKNEKWGEHIRIDASFSAN